MDFVRLVESGKYKLDDLSPTGKAYVMGLQYASECIENLKADCDPEGDSVLERMIAEYKVKVIDECIERLKSDICEAIVSINDEEQAEREEAEDLPFC